MRGAVRAAPRAASTRARPRARPPPASLLGRHGLLGRDRAQLPARSEAHAAATLRVVGADLRRLAARCAGRPCDDGPIVALFSADEPVALRSEETVLVRVPEQTGEPAPAWVPLVVVAHSQYVAGIHAGNVHRALVRLEWV